MEESNKKFEKIKIKDNFHRSLTDSNRKSDNTNRIQISNPNAGEDYDYELDQGNQRSYTVNFSDSINGEELEAIKRLKEYCERMNLAYNSNIYTDNLLLRLLRSARFGIKAAYKKLVNYIKFSQDFDIFNIKSDIFPNIDKIKLFYPHNFHKTTIFGEPIFIQMLGQLKIDDINRILPEPLLTKYIVFKLNELENIIFPKCSSKYNRSINKVFCIVDLLGLTTSLMNKNILNFVMKQMNIVSNYFPGILGGLYFINTGLIFRGIWTTCKYLYNAQTRNRIKLLGFQYKSELLSRVKEENLPKFIGGQCNCDPYGCLFSNVGPWNEEEIVSKGEKRRKVDHLKKIRAITQGVKNNDDDLDDNIDDEENEEIDEDEKDTNDNNNKIMNKDKEIKNNNGNNNEIKNMEDEINDNVNIDELKGPNDIS
jgi:hypothetical protein